MDTNKKLTLNWTYARFNASDGLDTSRLVLSANKIYDQLGIELTFEDWWKGLVERFDLQENIDYVIVEEFEPVEYLLEWTPWQEIVPYLV